MSGGVSVNAELVKKAKEAIKIGRLNGRVINVSEAFKKFPVEKEMHKGRIESFKKEDVDK